MIAYKGFNRNLSCTMGEGVFHYEVGGHYTTETAETARTGFHCCEEPMDILRWYRDGRYCMVEAGGDISEDGGRKIACTELTVIKELTLAELGAHECAWMMAHPKRECSRYVSRDVGQGFGGGLVVVRGKHPKASGGLHDIVFLVTERAGQVRGICVFEVNGASFLPGVAYTPEEVRQKDG